MPTIQQFLQDQYTATSATRCIKVYIPDDDSYVPLLAGLLALAGSPENYQDPLSAQAEGVAATWSDAYRQSDWDGCGTPPECIKMDTSLILFPPDMVVQSGNNFAWFNNTAQELAGYWQQQPAATADQWRCDRWLAPGVWEYTFTYVRATAAGKGDFYVTKDFSSYLEFVNFDFRGTALMNARFAGSFTVPEPGGKFIIGFDGTGASSGGTFTRPFSRLEMYKSADL
jgi:hypothetical protein